MLTGLSLPQRDDFMHNYTASLPLSRQPVHHSVRFLRVVLESSRVLSCDVFVATLHSCAACALRSCWTLCPALQQLRLDMPADTVLTVGQSICQLILPLPSAARHQLGTLALHRCALRIGSLLALETNLL